MLFYTFLGIITRLNLAMPQDSQNYYYKFRTMLNFLNFSLKFIIVFIVVIAFFAFSTLWYFSIGLPDYKKLSDYQPPISSRVYSENSKLIAEYALEKRLFIPYESIPDKLVNSFLSAEDKNFLDTQG